jgi:hypothetical protein
MYCNALRLSIDGDPALTSRNSAIARARATWGDVDAQPLCMGGSS